MIPTLKDLPGSLDQRWSLSYSQVPHGKRPQASVGKLRSPRLRASFREENSACCLCVYTKQHFALLSLHGDGGLRYLEMYSTDSAVLPGDFSLTRACSTHLSNPGLSVKQQGWELAPANPRPEDYLRIEWITVPLVKDFLRTLFTIRGNLRLTGGSIWWLHSFIFFAVLRRSMMEKQS